MFFLNSNWNFHFCKNILGYKDIKYSSWSVDDIRSLMDENPKQAEFFKSVYYRYMEMLLIFNTALQENPRRLKALIGDDISAIKIRFGNELSLCATDVYIEFSTKEILCFRIGVNLYSIYTFFYSKEKQPKISDIEFFYILNTMLEVIESNKNFKILKKEILADNRCFKYKKDSLIQKGIQLAKKSGFKYPDIKYPKL